MKSVSEIEKTISQLIQEARDLASDPDKKRLVSQKKNRISFLEICKLYLEHNPSEDFITKERNRLNNRLEKIDREFDQHFLLYNTGSSLLAKETLKKEYNKSYEVDKLYKQLRALDFLLS